jgi:hypothetical protein
MRVLRDREARLRARRLILFLARWLSLTVCLDLRDVSERVLIVAATPLSVSSNDRRKKMTRRTEALYDINPCACPRKFTCAYVAQDLPVVKCHPLKIQQLCDSKRVTAAWQQKSNFALKPPQGWQAADSRQLRRDIVTTV